MENAYGIGTNNRYELFCLDDDTSDATGAAIARKAKLQKKAAAKAAAAAAEKENKATAAAAAVIQAQIEASAAAKALEAGANKRGPRGQQRPIRDSQNIRGTTGANSGPREDNFSKPGFDRAAHPRPTGDREQRFNRRTRDENQPERRPAADGEARPPRRANNGFAGAGGQRRTFDRKSGSDKTGVKAVDKREGGGAHNWGTHKQDIEDLNKSDWDTDKEAAAASAAGSPQSGSDESTADAGVEHKKEETAEQKEAAAAAAEAARLAEEEARELTLDEWRAQRTTRAKPQFNIRKAGEGEDTSQWKQMVELQSRKKTEIDSDEDLEYDPSLYPQRVGRQKHLLEIEFHFNDGRRSGTGTSRRGPGGPRSGPGGPGGRPAGGPAGARPPRRDQRNGGEAPAVVAAPAPVAAVAEVPTVEVVVEEARPAAAAAVESRKPRAPRADDRRRPYEDRQHRGGYAGGVGQNAPQVNDERAFPSLG